MANRIATIRNSFLAGLLTVVPMGITIWLTVWVFNFVTALIPKLLNSVPSSTIDDLMENRFFVFGVRLVGLLIVSAGFVLVGFIAKLVFVREMLVVMERLVLKLPMISTIYTTAKQMGHAIMRGGGTGMFRQVVLLEYPRRGCYVIGFITAPGSEECEAATGKRLLNVFVPTTPNPTSGFLMMLPREDVIVLDMSVTDGMRMVISGGAVRPPARLAADPVARPILLEDTRTDQDPN